MGNTQGGVIKSSPLGCILAHWKDIAGTGNTESKRNLVKYCNQWWPLYTLENEAKWPFNGTLDYNTLLQLMLFLRREGKWDEVSYADTFSLSEIIQSGKGTAGLYLHRTLWYSPLNKIIKRNLKAN